MIGFGYDKNHVRGYSFRLTISSDGRADIFEVTTNPDVAERKRLTATISHAHWPVVSKSVMVEFNDRLKLAGQRRGRWNKVNTDLAPHFGKELTLLAWAIAGRDHLQLDRIVANWRALAPEERWWFYTTINAGGANVQAATGWMAGFRLAMLAEPDDLLGVHTAIDGASATEKPKPNPIAKAETESTAPPSAPIDDTPVQQGRLFAEPDAPLYDPPPKKGNS